MSSRGRHRGPRRRRARPREGGLLAALHDRGHRSSPCATRWASARCASASSPVGQLAARTPTSSRASPRRSTSSAPSSCATSSPARWSSSTARASARVRLAGEGAAAHVRLRVRLLRAPRLAARRPERLRGAQGARRAARRGAPRRGGRRHPACPTRACRAPSATPPQLGIPFEMGLIRSHYVGRTFIEPQQSIRHFGVRLKLNPVEPLLRGKRVVVVDDSIVRGTTSRKIVKMVRDAGAREVHLRISSPPTAVALLLRHRHADAARAHRVEPLRRRDRPLRHGRLARLPVARGDARGRRRVRAVGRARARRSASRGGRQRAGE